MVRQILTTKSKHINDLYEHLSKSKEESRAQDMQIVPTCKALLVVVQIRYEAIFVHHDLDSFKLQPHVDTQ